VTGVLPSPCSPAPDIACRVAAGAQESAEHARIRRAVFVDEQQLFTNDRDAHDQDEATVYLLGLVNGQPAGAVRLYPFDAEDVWKGDRLAVLPQYRRSRIGGPLVRLAVATAKARGASRMVAQVQAANTAFFLSLGWRADGEPYDYLGLPHQPMWIAC